MSTTRASGPLAVAGPLAGRPGAAPGATPGATRWAGRRPAPGRVLAALARYAVLLGLAALMLMPLLWTVTTSLKSPGDAYVYPPQWLPSWPFHWENYANGFRLLPFGTFYRNTVAITLAATAGATFTSALVGYAFARFRAPGSGALFVVLLATMMIPYQVTMIPQFILFKSLGWLNTYLPLVVPSWLGGGAFYIFLLRQFLRTVPRELDDAARLDGCGDYQIFWHVILPLARPALATVAIFSFVAHWNDFLGPLIYLTRDSLYTVSLGLRYLQNSGAQGVSDVTALMAMSLVATLPTIVLFFVAQKQFIQGIVTTGIKG